MSSLVLLLYQAARMTPQLYSASWKWNTRWPIQPKRVQIPTVTVRFNDVSQKMDMWDVLCLVCMSSAPGCGVALFFPIRLLITDGVVWLSAPFWWHAHSVPTFNCPEHSNTKSRLWWTEATSSYQFSAKGRVRRISRIMRNSEADTVFSSNSGSGLKLLRAMAWFMMRAMGLHIKNKKDISFILADPNHQLF